MITPGCVVTSPTGRVKGSGRVILEEREVSGFNKIKVTGVGQI